MGTDIRPELSAKNRYWISKHRYYELKHFCMQYPEWKAAYRNLDGMIYQSPVDWHVRSGDVSDPTALYVQDRLYYRERLEMIERVAQEAVSDLAELMILAVTEGVSYDHISPPCCKEVWYIGYRRFFWLLDKARK